MNKIEELRYLIKAIDKEGEAYYSQLLAPLSITPNQNEVLKILDVKNGLSIKEIGQLLICGSDSPSRVIQRLIDKDLVVKVSDENDERKVNVILTPTGKKLLKESAKIEEEFNQHIQDEVSQYVDIKLLITILSNRLHQTKTLDKINKRKGLTRSDRNDLN